LLLLLLLLLVLLLGHVITNYHVITDASDIQVTFMGGAEYSAKVIGVDQDKDVAVLQVLDCRRLCPKALGPESDVLHAVLDVLAVLRFLVFATTAEGSQQVCRVAGCLQEQTRHLS
jgi:hypothetical protein